MAVDNRYTHLPSHEFTGTLIAEELGVKPVKLLFILGAMGASQGFAGEPQECGTFLRVVSTARTTAGIAWTGTRHVLKATMYDPLGAGYSLASEIFTRVRNRDAHQWWRIPYDIFKRDKWHLAIYEILWLIARGTGLTYYQFEQATSEFDEDDESIRVIVDAFKDDDVYGGSVRYLYEKRHAHRKNVFLVQPTSFLDLVTKLSAVAKENGPISRLDYFGHGLPEGLRDLGFDRLPLRLQTGAARRYHGKYIESPSDMREVFTPDIQVRFNSCFLGSGSMGENACDRSARQIVGVNGAKIYSGKVQILPNLVDHASFLLNAPEPPKALRWLGDKISVGYVAPLTFVSSYRLNGREGTDSVLQWNTTKITSIPSMRNLHVTIDTLLKESHQGFEKLRAEYLGKHLNMALLGEILKRNGHFPPRFVSYEDSSLPFLIKVESDDDKAGKKLMNELWENNLLDRNSHLYLGQGSKGLVLRVPWNEVSKFHDEWREQYKRVLPRVRTMIQVELSEIRGLRERGEIRPEEFDRLVDYLEGYDAFVTQRLMSHNSWNDRLTRNQRDNSTVEE